MDAARVVVIEDNDLIRLMVCARLEEEGHSIVGQASNLDQAIESVEEISSGKIEADVIVADANLSSNYREPGEDIRAVAGKAKEEGLTTKIILYSTYSMADLGVEVDADSGKDIDEVVRAIERF